MKLALDILFSFEMVILAFLTFCQQILSIIFILLLDLPRSSVGRFIHHRYLRLHNQQLDQLQEPFKLFLLHSKCRLFRVWHLQVLLITYQQRQAFRLLARRDLVLFLEIPHGDAETIGDFTLDFFLNLVQPLLKLFFEVLLLCCFELGEGQSRCRVIETTVIFFLHPAAKITSVQ